jgi:hypothetical protein
MSLLMDGIILPVKLSTLAIASPTPNVGTDLPAVTGFDPHNS